MEIKLKSLQLDNFKGIKQFKFDPDGKNAIIYGDNATGKTTVADGFRWLLFGKDTRNQADFQLKTVDQSGQEYSGMDHTVKAVIEIDGTPLELQKTYREKWTKRRGEAQKTLTGHTTLHYIEGVPVQQKKWASRLADLIDENIFKLVTLPSYFNSLHWERRREILVQICGDISDADVIASAAELKALPEILGDRSLEDHRKIIQAEKRSINERLKEIPARIDELNKTLPTEFRNRPAIEAYINLIDQKIERARDDTELADLRKQLADAQVELSKARAEQTRKNQAVNEEIDEKISRQKAKIRDLKNKLADAESIISRSARTVQKNDEIMLALRSRYAAIVAQKPHYDEICPTCNQPLPRDQIETAKAKFKENQAKTLTKINDEGKALKAENISLQSIIDEGQKDIHKWIIALGRYQELIEMAEAEKVWVNPEIPGETIELSEKIAHIEKSIADHSKTDTSILEAERREEQAKLAALDTAEKSKARINELKQEEKDLSEKFEEIERQIFLMEKFIVTKVNLLEDKINSCFDLARFKLFETQINEGIRETCITTVNGVPYGFGLNKGMEMNAGLDIIKTLSKYYDIQAPVWIDNAEAVTKLLQIPSQTFKLIVHPDYPEMEVNYD